MTSTETGVIYCDDNLNRMSQMPAESVDLIYLDPPFFSNRVYEVIWGDEAEVRSFEDRWEGGIQLYTEWMRQRVHEMWRLLKPTGSIFLHCDPHASHYLKVMLDGIFGPERFINEIVWKRSTAHNDLKQGAKHMGRLHDTILFYTKSENYTFNTQMLEYSESYVSSKYRYVDAKGRLYRLDNLTGPGGAAKGNPEYELMGVTRHWRYSRERMAALVEAGRIVQTRPGSVPQYKRYLDEMTGVSLQDVWTDVDPINSRASERLGYPTQKPIALLERIIKIATNPEDVVLDPFCGCGTTVDASERLGRDWIGIDISPTAVNIVDRRLKRIIGARWPRLVGLPSTVDNLRTLAPFEFQNWVIQQFFGLSSPRKSGDMGIDGYTFFTHDPIQVKRSDRVGRNVVDNFETAVRRDGSKAGWIVAFSFTRDAREEAARARWEEKLDINLVTVAEMLRPKSQRRGPFWPEPATVTDLPLNPPRDISRITGDVLIESDRSSRAV